MFTVQPAQTTVRTSKTVSLAVRLVVTTFAFIAATTFDSQIGRLGASDGDTVLITQTHVAITTETFDPAAFPLEAFGD